MHKLKTGPASVCGVLLLYGGLSIAISWPLARDFTTALTGNDLDALSHLWGVWHAIQAFAGREPLFSTTLLYYPFGSSLLLHAAGPLPAVFALPFWPLGPVAGYNGAVLVGLTLTGFCMYLLARELGCSRSASFFAGVVLLAAPVHLVGLRGHLEKVFLGLIPLAFIALQRAFDPSRSILWTAVFAAATLLLLLQSPFQFVQVALATMLFIVIAAVRVHDRRPVAIRTLAAALAVLVIAGPLLVAIVRAAGNPDVLIDRQAESPRHQPDLLQFVLPPSFGRFLGQRTMTTLERWGVTPGIETEVAVPWTAMLLGGAAAVFRSRAVNGWIVLAFGSALLSLGPTLQAFGQTVMGGLPYAWLTALPGFDFLRTPPRFMQAGFVGIAAAAGMGLAAAASRLPRGRVALAAAATIATLIEVWPVPWPVHLLDPTPAFYQELAGDSHSYGVLDLPIRPLPDFSPIDYSARYQVHQMTHQKGIAGGYLSRTYARHPVSPCIFAIDRAPHDVRVDGEPSRCEPAAIHQLASHGYRYVVWHLPSDLTQDNQPGSWAADDASTFVGAAFGKQPPSLEDNLVRVWALPPPDRALPPHPVIELGAGWYPAEALWRWASSPALITITAPRALKATLVIEVPLLHGAQDRALGDESVLVASGAGDTSSTPVRAGGTIRVPLVLRTGAQEVTFALGAGNFRPSDYGDNDSRVLSFAIGSMDLVTGENEELRTKN